MSGANSRACSSEFQDIVIFESASHGRVMLLDGVVQITEADEFVYQEMLTHVPLLAHGAARRVLIIGAGDGGVLRRVLQHRGVERAVMVEIDGEVIRLCQGIPAGHRRRRVERPACRGDRRRRHRLCSSGRRPGSFDVVIVDSTDPIGVGEVLFTDEFYENAARLLTDRGLIVNQCGVPAMQADELRDTSLRGAAASSRDVWAYVAAVPTYVGGFMTLGWAAKDAGMPSSGRADDSRARRGGGHAGHHAVSGRPRSMRAPSTCRLTSRSICPNRAERFLRPSRITGPAASASLRFTEVVSGPFGTRQRDGRFVLVGHAVSLGRQQLQPCDASHDQADAA